MKKFSFNFAKAFQWKTEFLQLFLRIIMSYLQFIMRKISPTFFLSLLFFSLTLGGQMQIL